jgi:[ribosomal protein S5]-alanine N-acetyltransferase
VDVPAIATERLELVSFSPQLLEAILGGDHEKAEERLGAPVPPGWPDRAVTRFLRLRLDQLRRDPALRPWLGRFVVRRAAPRTLIGHAGFHGPPGTNALRAADALELGYALFPEHRGRGYATEAVLGLIAWAREEHGIHRFVASVSPENEPSLALVRRLGFVRVGDHWDEEDGLEHEFELSTPALP